MADEKVLTIALSKVAAELAEKHEMSKKAASEFLGAFVEHRQEVVTRRSRFDLRKAEENARK